MELELKYTCIFGLNNEAWLSDKRRALNEGGTRATKTFSIIQLLILIAQNTRSPLLISIVSESLPHLKRGAIRDFFNILGEGEGNNKHWNKTDKVYTLSNALIEFFGADESEKLRGAGRDILFINEANNVSYSAYKELDVRTSKFTFLDWNPVGEFWGHEHLMNEPENVYIHSTYLDAFLPDGSCVLPQSVVANIESNKGKDPNWWNIYGLGLLGKIEGLVYPAFGQVDELPNNGREFYGLDWGYSTDPTVLLKCVIKDDALYAQELIYETGLTNDAIAHRMDEVGVKRNYDEIFADSAEPKSIAEICAYGFNIKGAPKGPGSVEYGHQKVRQYKQFWTKDSLKCIKEQRNFRYIEDKNGKLTNKTTHNWSHGMDARRYGIAGIFEPGEPKEKIIIYDAISAEGVNLDL